MAGLRVAFILLISFAVDSQGSSAQHGRNQKAAVVVGTVHCDTCFHQKFSGYSRFISGATVAVECGGRKQSFNFRKEVQTDRHGKLKVELPFTVSHETTRIGSCSVSLVKSNEPYCSVVSRATTSSLGLKSRKAGRHVFSAGFLTFRPLQQPDLCYQKPTITSTSKYDVPRFPFVPRPNPPSAAGSPAFPFPPLLNLPYLPPLLTLTPLINVAPPPATLIKAIKGVRTTRIKVNHCKLQALQFTTCTSMNSLPEASPFPFTTILNSALRLTQKPVFGCSFIVGDTKLPSACYIFCWKKYGALTACLDGGRVREKIEVLRLEGQKKKTLLVKLISK